MYIRDEELIQSYLNGEESALRDLIVRYFRVVYNFVLRYTGNGPDAEDITQEVFVKVWKNLKRYDPKSSFRTWLFSIAKNAAIDWLRKKKATPLADFDEDGALVETLQDLAPLPNEVAERNNASRAAVNAIAKLSRDAQSILFLRYQRDLTFRAIASALGRPLHTVKSRHRRVLARLKKILTI